MPFHLKERSLSLLFPRLFNFFGEKRRENAACAATRCVLSPFPPRLATSRLDAYPGGPVASSGQWAGSDDVSWANGRRGGALSSDTRVGLDSEGLNAEGGMPGRLPPQCCDNNMLRWDLKDVCTQSVFV